MNRFCLQILLLKVEETINVPLKSMRMVNAEVHFQVKRNTNSNSGNILLLLNMKIRILFIKFWV